MRPSYSEVQSHVDTPEQTLAEADRPTGGAETLPEKKPGTWAKGQSGNPKGRPIGSRNKTSIIREMVEQDLTEILATDARSLLKVATELAQNGDTAMLKLLLERLIPLRGASEDLKKRTPPTITINVGRTQGSGGEPVEGPITIDGQSFPVEENENGKG